MRKKLALIFFPVVLVAVFLATPVVAAGDGSQQTPFEWIGEQLAQLITAVSDVQTQNAELKSLVLDSQVLIEELQAQVEALPSGDPGPTTTPALPGLIISGYNESQSSNTFPEEEPTYLVRASLTKPWDTDVYFTYRTVDGTAKSNEDYKPWNDVVRIPVGVTQVIFARGGIIDDSIKEGSEYFLLEVDNVVNAQLIDLGKVIILDND